MAPKFLDRLAVCSWSLQSSNPRQLIQQLNEIGIPRLQCALDPLRNAPNTWGALPQECAQAGITLVSGMLTTVGEDYSSLETIRRTGGVVPDATWEENWRNIQDIAEIAQKLNLKLVTFHAGFLPHEENGPQFKKVLDRIARIADLFAAKGIDLGFETGQETADTLRLFLQRLNRSNAGVNFDPANMILYDKGDPIDALRQLGPWLKQCHIKDAIKTKQPGAWGDEVVVGAGQVNWPLFFQTLSNLKFKGYCPIEREAGSQRVQDIRQARLYLDSIFDPEYGN